MGYAFISYSTRNQNEADALRNYLRKQGIQTWMAPGDIPAGSTYAQVINQAVRDCSCFVLILTDAAQNSVWVPKEVERAVSYRKPIIPLQLEDLSLNDEFSFYISTDQVVAVKKIDESSENLRKILDGICLHCGYGGENSGGYDSAEDTLPAGVSYAEDNPAAGVSHQGTNIRTGSKSRIAAGLLYILFYGGIFGDFYLGYKKRGLIKTAIMIVFSLELLFFYLWEEEYLWEFYGSGQEWHYYVMVVSVVIGIVAITAVIARSVYDGIMTLKGKRTDAKGNALLG